MKTTKRQNCQNRRNVRTVTSEETSGLSQTKECQNCQKRRNVRTVQNDKNVTNFFQMSKKSWTVEITINYQKFLKLSMENNRNLSRFWKFRNSRKSCNCNINCRKSLKSRKFRSCFKFSKKLLKTTKTSQLSKILQMSQMPQIGHKFMEHHNCKKWRNGRTVKNDESSELSKATKMSQSSPNDKKNSELLKLL